MKTLPFLSQSLAALGLLLLALPTHAEETVTLRVAPERDLLYRGGSREIILEVELKAKRPTEKHRTPLNLSVVLDRSGSMAGAKIEKARQAAGAALDRLEPDDYFSLVIYDNDAEVLLPPERAGSRAHREEMKERISRIQPGGSTALYAGVQLGAQQVRKFIDQERVNRVILLSDGLANVGPQRTSDLVKVGSGLRKDGMSVTTIGLGDDFNEDLMTALAEASHANYYYVQDAEKLPGIFAEEFGAAGTRIASGLRLRVEVPAGVEIREILGHPEMTCEGRSAQISLPELFGGEQRLFHLRCRVEEAAPEALALATVALSYDDAATQKRQAQEGAASVRLTNDAQKSEGSVREETARHVATLQNRLDKEAAVRLADAGRGQDAAALLRQRVGVNASAPAAQQIPGVAQENQKLELWADELSRNGALGKDSRKAVQWDNYQDKYQKK